jgi:Fic family protein
MADLVLNRRQELILKRLERSSCAIDELWDYVKTKGFDDSKVTINRDLKELLELGFIARTGKARATQYKISTRYSIFREINFGEYFSVESDDRSILENFNFEIFDNLADIFTDKEKLEFELLHKRFLARKIDKGIRKRELERIIIELCWKSSKMEGNTYSLLDTERLIKEHIESSGKSKEESIMILNHKKALDYVLKNKSKFKKISFNEIIKIHEILTKGLDIKSGIRKSKVGILGTKYKPLAGEDLITKALKHTIKLLNNENFIIAKAFLALLLLSYIQAFVDGNKRTARILSTAILLAYDYCPISYRNVDEFEYKKFLILFYEQNNVFYFKKLFKKAYEFSIQEYSY